MGKNTIYYGPPGTGKTYLLQELMVNYIGFNISDEDIEKSYLSTSKEWVPIVLILLNNNNSLRSEDIQTKIGEVIGPTYNISVSTILSDHSVELSSNLTLESSDPRIFNQHEGKWFVILENLLLYKSNFLSEYIDKDSMNERYSFVTFHQSFVYEDFVEGIRPLITNETNQMEGEIGYSIEPGVFKKICEEAVNNSQMNYAIFIDEINRGNISEIFGELITLIETDKRLGEANQLEVTLPYSKKKFGVPKNLDIIGTMNSADRSIATIDIALRRRFNFISSKPDPEKLKLLLEKNNVDPRDIEGIDLIKLFEILNKRIESLLDSNFAIGHAYFTNVKNYSDLLNVLVKKIIPLLEEYFFEDLKKVQMILNDLDSNGDLKSNAIYKSDLLETDRLFEYVGDYINEDKTSYFTSDNIEKHAVIKIYE